MLPCCNKCSGTGWVETGRNALCGSCDGTGRFSHDTSKVCPACQGLGHSSSRETRTCDYCSGTGIDTAEQSRSEQRKAKEDAAAAARQKAERIFGKGTTLGTGGGKTGGKVKSIRKVRSLFAVLATVASGLFIFGQKPEEPIFALTGAAVVGLVAYSYYRQIAYLSFASAAAFLLYQGHKGWNTKLVGTETAAPPVATAELKNDSANILQTAPNNVARPSTRQTRDPDMRDGRLWDMVGGGRIYDEMFTDGEYDLSKASSLTISKQKLIESCAKDPEFQKILEKMGLPDPINNSDMQRITMGLYAYQVLKRDGKPGFEDRVAGIFSGKGLLEEAERAAILNAIRGISTGSFPPVVPNTQFDMQLLKYTHTHDSAYLRDEKGAVHPAHETRAWMKNEFAPDKGAGSMLTPNQVSMRFWHYESFYMGFPKESITRPISPETIKLMQSVPGLDGVKEPMKYEDLNRDQTVAYFRWREREEPGRYRPGTADKVAETLDKVANTFTAVEVWDNPRGKQEHAVIFISAQRRMMDETYQ